MLEDQPIGVVRAREGSRPWASGEHQASIGSKATEAFDSVSRTSQRYPDDDDAPALEEPSKKLQVVARIDHFCLGELAERQQVALAIAEPGRRTGRRDS